MSGKLFTMDEDKYRGLPAANYSTLKYGRESPLAMKAAIDGKCQPASNGVTLGTIVDHMVSGATELTYAIAPDVDRRTRDGKAEWAAFQEKYKHLKIITQDQADESRLIADAVLAHPDAARLLRGKHRQVVARWIDPTTGVECKARIDAFTPGVCLTDLKTTRSALDERSFAREVAKFSYHIQAAFYTDGFKECTGIDTPFTIVAVQNRQPYDVAVFRLSDESIAAGRSRYKRYLAMWKAGHESGLWPGVDRKIVTLDIPQWEIDAAAWEEQSETTDTEHPF